MKDKIIRTLARSLLFIFCFFGSVVVIPLASSSRTVLVFADNLTLPLLANRIGGRTLNCAGGAALIQGAKLAQLEICTMLALT